MWYTTNLVASIDNSDIIKCDCMIIAFVHFGVSHWRFRFPESLLRLGWAKPSMNGYLFFPFNGPKQALFTFLGRDLQDKLPLWLARAWRFRKLRRWRVLQWSLASGDDCRPGSAGRFQGETQHLENGSWNQRSQHGTACPNLKPRIISFSGDFLRRFANSHGNMEMEGTNVGRVLWITQDFQWTCFIHHFLWPQGFHVNNPWMPNVHNARWWWGREMMIGKGANFVSVLPSSL